MDLRLFRQLTRLRRVKDWNEDSKGGRKPKFTPLDGMRYNLEEKIFFEEYVQALRSKC